MMRVRVMSAIALARMGATSQLSRMRHYMGPKVTLLPSSLAIRWAVNRLTAENLPEPEPAKHMQSGWFLEPLDDLESETR